MANWHNGRIETLGSPFIRPELLSQLNFTDQLGFDPQETVERSFLGCPEYLLAAIQRLSAIRDSIPASKPLGKIAILSYIRSTSSVLERIHRFDSFVWASNLLQHCSSQEMNNLGTLSEAYKFGALIYGRRVLEALGQDVSFQEDFISELFGQIDALRVHSSLFKCVLWPIFVAGLECQQSQRRFISGHLERFWEVTKCVNVINASEILQVYWQREDQTQLASSGWIFSIGRLERDWLLI